MSKDTYHSASSGGKQPSAEVAVVEKSCEEKCKERFSLLEQIARFEALTQNSRKSIETLIENICTQYQKTIDALRKDISEKERLLEEKKTATDNADRRFEISERRVNEIKREQADALKEVEYENDNLLKVSESLKEAESRYAQMKQKYDGMEVQYRHDVQIFEKDVAKYRKDEVEYQTAQEKYNKEEVKFNETLQKFNKDIKRAERAKIKSGFFQKLWYGVSCIVSLFFHDKISQESENTAVKETYKKSIEAEQKCQEVQEKFGLRRERETLKQRRDTLHKNEELLGQKRRMLKNREIALEQKAGEIKRACSAVNKSDKTAKIARAEFEKNEANIKKAKDKSEKVNVDLKIAEEKLTAIVKEQNTTAEALKRAEADVTEAKAGLRKIEDRFSQELSNHDQIVEQLQRALGILKWYELPDGRTRHGIPLFLPPEKDKLGQTYLPSTIWHVPLHPGITETFELKSFPQGKQWTITGKPNTWQIMDNSKAVILIRREGEKLQFEWTEHVDFSSKDNVVLAVTHNIDKVNEINIDMTACSIPIAYSTP